MKYDKGNGIVLLNTNDYNNKLNTILADNSKFTTVNVPLDPLQHPIIKLENSVKYYINKYFPGKDNKNLRDKLTPVGSQPGKLYGMAKIHKPNIPLRPVVSMTNSATYHLAQYLDNILKPHINTSYMLNSSFDFIDKLNNLPTPLEAKTLCSFDVVNLFTNIPLNETIDIACDLVFNSNIQLPFKKHEFKKLLTIASGGIFSFNNTLYKQTDGVTMGSPLGPTLANIFMSHAENTYFMSSNTSNKPYIYFRYIDDIFCIFHSPNQINNFLNTLNQFHPNLKFTVEHAVDNCLPFLDISVNTTTNKPTTSLYRKPTFTNLILNFKSFCPLNYKLGLIKCLLFRAYKICSTWTNFHVELTTLHNIFSMNAYPSSLFHKISHSFLHKTISNKQPLPKQDKLFDYTLTLPYFGSVSEKFKQKIQKFFKKYNYNVAITFKTFKVSRYFSLKDPTPFSLQSNVVYKFTCPIDGDITYIGKTKRHLVIRINEHFKTHTSPIFSHTLQCNDCRSNFHSNFKILSHSQSDFDNTLKESLLIKYYMPSLNYMHTHLCNTSLLNLFN